jgi:hypothetical protein
MSFQQDMRVQTTWHVLRTAQVLQCVRRGLKVDGWHAAKKEQDAALLDKLVIVARGGQGALLSCLNFDRK